MPKDTCLYDYTFELTEHINIFFREHKRLREWIMIADSATYDLSMIFFMYMFGVEDKYTMRMLFANGFVAASKIVF